MKKILVLGASGSLGRGVVRQLKQEHKVTATYSSNQFDETGVDVRQIDVMDSESLHSLGDDYSAAVLIVGAMPAAMEGYHPQR